MNGSDMNHNDSGAPGAPAMGPARGPQVGAGFERSYRSPFLATFLSLMPGLGQAWLGYYQQGFINIAVVAGCITALSSNRLEGIEPFIALGMAFYWLYNMVDANRRAHHLYRVSAGLGAEEFTDEFPLPRPQGSLFGGVVLVLIGLLVIMDLNFGVSMEWIEDWWPLALVILGARMVWQARRKAA